MVEALQWFIGLGSKVFLPIIIIIIALFFGVQLSKAIISGITVGIGSVSYTHLDVYKRQEIYFV